MKNILKGIWMYSLLILVTGCVKESYPDQSIDEVVSRYSVNSSLGAVIANTSPIGTSRVVWAVVTGVGEADGTQNMVWLQDDNHGIALKVEQEAITFFKKGDLVILQTKNLEVVKENHFMLLTKGGRAISIADIEDLAKIAAQGQEVLYPEISPAQLSEAYQQRVVTLSNMEFLNEEADEIMVRDGESITSRMLIDCGGVDLRLDAVAGSMISALLVPSGRGAVTGLVYSIGEGKFGIRPLDAERIKKMTNIRCAGSGDISLSFEVKKLKELASGTTIAAGKELRVVNLTSVYGKGGIVVQDASGGILIEGINPTAYPVNTALIIKIGGKELINNDGVYSIKNVSSADVAVAGTYSYPEKDAAINNGSDPIEVHKLVRLNAVEARIYDSTATDFIYRIRDASGYMYSSMPRTNNVLTGVTDAVWKGSLTGYISKVNNRLEFLPRNNKDYTSGNVVLGKDEVFIYEDFKLAAKKGGYGAADVVAPTGTWFFDQSLVWDTEPTDPRPMSPRLIGPNQRDANWKGPGYIQTKFAIKGLKRVRAQYINNAAVSYIGPEFVMEVQYSVDAGASWISLGTGTTSRGVYKLVDFAVNVPKTQAVMVRFLNQSPQPPGVAGNPGAHLLRGNVINIVKTVIETE